MPTGGSETAADRTLGGLIKDNQQTHFQLSRRQKRSRCAGPLQNDKGIAVGDYVNSLGETNGLVFNTILDTFITLNDPHGVLGTTLNGINDEGQIVGFYVDPADNTDGLLASRRRSRNPRLGG